MPRRLIPDRADKSDDSPMLRRTLILAAGLGFWMLLIVARLYYLQIIQYVHWLDRAHRQQQRTVELAPERGTIYDSQMRPLAMSLPVDSVYAVPSHIPDSAMVGRLLAPVLDLTPADIEARFAVSRTFCWVKRKVTTVESARIKALDLKGIYFQKEMKRFYPMNDLAASVIGYVGMDDKGLAGLEQSYDNVIRGRPGHALLMEDARRQTFSTHDDPGKPGMNVVLTLDSTIQYVAQRVLDADVAKWHAKDGVVVVEDPETGAILAMASSPRFNPNSYAESPPEDRIDRGVAWIYEPGSVFKSITISSAIQDGRARPTDYIDCQMGAIALGGRTIHDVRDAIRHELAGPLRVSQVLAYSSDVGAVKIALRLGEDRFYEYIRKFGFGSKTDIGLPGEERGLLMPPEQWSGVSIGEFAIGQGIGVTPIQLATAYSAIANGGTLIQPRIVQDVFRDGVHAGAPPQWRRQALGPQTAATMRQMLEGVVDFGTGMAAQLDGYSAGGKTGTAQKVENGRYSHTHYVASFIGMAPIHHPALVILVSIDSPEGGIYGAEVAAPAWREIAQESLSYLGVPRDQPLSPQTLLASSRATGAGPNNGVSSAHGPSAESALDAPPGSLPSRPETPASGTRVINTEPLVSVPDFSGMDQRRVADECQALGFQLALSGSGLAIQQDPAAGSKAPQGSTVDVAFAR